MQLVFIINVQWSRGTSDSILQHYLAKVLKLELRQRPQVLTGRSRAGAPFLSLHEDQQRPVTRTLSAFPCASKFDYPSSAIGMNYSSDWTFCPQSGLLVGLRIKSSFILFSPATPGDLLCPAAAIHRGVSKVAATAKVAAAWDPIKETRAVEVKNCGADFHICPVLNLRIKKHNTVATNRGQQYWKHFLLSSRTGPNLSHGFTSKYILFIVFIVCTMLSEWLIIWLINLGVFLTVSGGKNNWWQRLLFV